MSYLAKLKADVSEKALPSELTKPTKAPSVSFVSAPSRHVSEIEAANGPLPDPAAEARRLRALTMLARNPALRIAVVCDAEGDPVPVAVAIRDKGMCEVHIPVARFDPFALLDLVARHEGTIH